MATKNPSAQIESYEERVKRLYTGELRDRLLATYRRLAAKQQSGRMTSEGHLCQ